MFKLSRSVMKLEKVVAFTASPPNEAKTNSLGFWLRKAAMSDSISEIKKKSNKNKNREYIVCSGLFFLGEGDNQYKF